MTEIKKWNLKARWKEYRKLTQVFLPGLCSGWNLYASWRKFLTVCLSNASWLHIILSLKMTFFRNVFALASKFASLFDHTMQGCTPVQLVTSIYIKISIFNESYLFSFPVQAFVLTMKGPAISAWRREIHASAKRTTTSCTIIVKIPAIGVIHPRTLVSSWILEITC